LAPLLLVSSKQFRRKTILMKEATPLIAGAGPVGLGAALYLAQANIKTRIIDATEKPVQESRALAVNPRTLEILESTGVTEKMLALGMPIRGVRFSQRGHPPHEILFKGQVQHKYPFILALSQATTGLRNKTVDRVKPAKR